MSRNFAKNEEALVRKGNRSCNLGRKKCDGGHQARPRIRKGRGFTVLEVAASWPAAVAALPVAVASGLLEAALLPAE